jgi:hypothetical protein
MLMIIDAVKNKNKIRRKFIKMFSFIKIKLSRMLNLFGTNRFLKLFKKE